MERSTSTEKDIDLYTLASDLWSKKWLILAITFGCTALAVTYSFITSPIYEAEARILPPTPSELTTYNLAAQLAGPALLGVVSNSEAYTDYKNATELSPKDAYKIFQHHLASSSIKQKFFNSVYQPALLPSPSPIELENLWNKYEKRLKINFPKTENDTLITIKLQDENAEKAAEWTNNIIKIAEETAQEQLLNTLKSTIELNKQITKDQSKALREIAETQRENNLKRHEDALAVAKSIKLETPSNSGNLITSYSGENLYLRGSKALEAEIELIKSRKNNDPYILELSDLQKKEALLNSIDIKPEKLKVMTIDKIANKPEKPIKPQKILYLIAGLVAGLTFSFLTVAFLTFFRRYQTSN